MRTLVFWLSMNLSRQLGVSVINTASILCYMMVNFMTFKISWNTDYLYYLCQTWFHGRHIIDASAALFPKCLNLPNVYAFILSKLLIALMGFPRLALVLHTETAHASTQSQLYDVCHGRYVVSQGTPQGCRDPECWFQLACHRVIWRRIVSHITKQTAVGKLKMIQHFLQM